MTQTTEVEGNQGKSKIVLESKFSHMFHRLCTNHRDRELPITFKLQHLICLNSHSNYRLIKHTGAIVTIMRCQNVSNETVHPLFQNNGQLKKWRVTFCAVYLYTDFKTVMNLYTYLYGISFDHGFFC